MGTNMTLFVTLLAPPAQVKDGAPNPFNVSVLPEQTELLLLVAVSGGIPTSTLTVTVVIEEVQFESIDPRTE